MCACVCAGVCACCVFVLGCACEQACVCVSACRCVRGRRHGAVRYQSVRHKVRFLSRVELGAMLRVRRIIACVFVF